MWLKLNQHDYIDKVAIKRQSVTTETRVILKPKASGRGLFTYSLNYQLLCFGFCPKSIGQEGLNRRRGRDIGDQKWSKDDRGGDKPPCPCYANEGGEGFEPVSTSLYFDGFPGFSEQYHGSGASSATAKRDGTRERGKLYRSEWEGQPNRLFAFCFFF